MESIKNYDLIEEGRECRMVASRDLAPGEVIFIEKPWVTGPGRNGYPVCVGCFQYPDGTSYCSKCGWQVQGDIFQCAGANIPYVKNDFRCVQNCASRLELTQNTSVKY